MPTTDVHKVKLPEKILLEAKDIESETSLKMYYVDRFREAYNHETMRDFPYIIATVRPQYHMIRYTPSTVSAIYDYEDLGYRKPITHEFRLFMPFLNFFFEFDGKYLTFLNVYGSINSLDTGAPPFRLFSNQDCLGDIAEDEALPLEDTDLVSMVKTIIPSYLSSNFNDDNGPWAGLPFVKEMKRKAGKKYDKISSSVPALRYWERLTPEGFMTQNFEKDYNTCPIFEPENYKKIYKVAPLVD